MAEPESEMSKNLVMMKRVNAVFTRFHWEQDEYIPDWCDRNGIMIQEELPAWGWGPKWNDSLYIIAKKQLYEIISTHHNHPSIISWGIGNELTSHDSITRRYLKGLYNYCRSLDTTRLINYVSNQLNNPLKGKNKVLPDAGNIGDVLMFNEYYSTWYNQNIDSISGALDRIHADYPGKSLVISEFGICEPVFKGGDARRIKEMKEQFRIYGEKPYVAGAIYFCLNDYRTHMGEDFTYPYPQRVHGISDIHSNAKPSYKELKSILSPLEIVSIKKKDGIASISVRCKTGIPAYTVRDYRIITSKKEVHTGEMNPGNKRLFELPYRQKSDTLRIIRPTGFEVMSVPL
jgi:beta-glucuronidase